MASSNDENFESQSKHDSQKILHDFETDSNNNQKKRVHSGNHRNKLHKSKKKKISQTKDVLNFSAKDLSFDDSDSGSCGKFQFCIVNKPFPI